MTGLPADTPPDRMAFARFLLVGGGAALVYAVVTAALVGRVTLVTPPVLSALVWLAFIPPVFWCHRRFSFRARRARRGALGLYALTQAVSLGIVTLAGALLVTHSFWADVFVYLGASALAAISSFVLNRWLVFPHAGAV